VAEPGVKLDKWLHAQPIDPPLRVWLYFDQSRFPQHPKVSRNSGTRDRQHPGKLGHCGGPAPQGLQHGPSVLIRQCLEYRVHTA
jgi:hypothetical protein